MFFFFLYTFVIEKPKKTNIMKHFNKRILTLLLAVLCIGGKANAQQNIQQLWVPDSLFIQHSIALFSEEAYIIAGTSIPGALSGNSDILVMAVHNNGAIVWSRYLDYGSAEEPTDEFVGSVKVDADKNIVLTGYTGQNNSPRKDLIVVKLDANGNFLGDIVVQDTNLDFGLYGFDIVQAGKPGVEEDYIVVGTGVQQATEAAPKYAFAMRVDQQLNSIQWSKVYGSTLAQVPPPPCPYHQVRFVQPYFKNRKPCKPGHRGMLFVDGFRRHLRGKPADGGQ